MRRETPTRLTAVVKPPLWATGRQDAIRLAIADYLASRQQRFEGSEPLHRLGPARRQSIAFHAGLGLDAWRQVSELLDEGADQWQR